MKTIVCYGDSLTYGANPAGVRHAFEDRWPSVLEAMLGHDKVRVIAEGLGGRTTAFDDHSTAADRNGARILPTIIASHEPIDCLVIMLGTNDMKGYLNGSALGAAMGMKRLAEIALTYPYKPEYIPPKIVLIAPPHCVATTHEDAKPMFEGAVTESLLLAKHYERVAQEMGCLFYDASRVAVASPIDGVHLDAHNTRAIGKGVAPVVAQALGL